VTFYFPANSLCSEGPKKNSPRGRLGLRKAVMKNPGTAAVLSFLVPGVGQIYNGKFLRAIFWLIITPGLWIGSGGTLGWICHIIAAYTAYSYAKSQLAGSP
jgi:TM2 domain-containing membrane protein YozV